MIFLQKVCVPLMRDMRDQFTGGWLKQNNRSTSCLNNAQTFIMYYFEKMFNIQ